MARTNQPAAQPSPIAKARQKSMLRCIALIILALIVLVGVAVLVIWLLVKPKHIVYTVEDASIHNFNLTKDKHLYSNFNFVIRSYNPNSKVSIYYDSVEVSVAYNDQTLATTAVPPFFQPHKNVTRLNAQLAAQSVSLYGSVPTDLEHEKSSGDVELEVSVRARIRFKVGIWKSQDRTLRVFCSPVLVYFSRSKTFDRTYCDVEL